MRKVLIGAIVVLAVLLTTVLGFIWYQTTHEFVDGDAYPKNAQMLDLTEKEISEEYFLELSGKLPNCQIRWNVPFQGSTLPSDTQQVTVKTLTEEDIRILKDYLPQLKRVDAAGCDDYPMVETLIARLPGCQVDYQVDLGGTRADPKTTELTLENGSFDFDTLMTNLTYLHSLQTLHLPKTELTPEQQTQLEEAFPGVQILPTVELLGQEYDTATTVLDLSAMTSDQVSQAAEKLCRLPQLSEIQLTGSSLTLQDVKAIKEAAPEAVIHYSCNFYGINVSTTDTEVMLKYVTVDDDNFADNLRTLLSVMENCQRVVLEARGPYDKLWQKITTEELSKIREEYRDQTKLVWRVYFGANGSTLTDAQVLRAVYGLTDDNSKDLIYCENVRYLDVGHDEFLDYMPFLAGMKDLEVAILSGAPLKDLSPIAACTNLKFLEIANCTYVTDIQALKSCTQLEMLNLSYTGVTDISVLNDLKLTHLTSVRSKIGKDVLERYAQDHPDCWVVYEGDQPYGTGWRYDKEGKYLPWYSSMVDAFHYPNAYNNIGWYLDK